MKVLLVSILIILGLSIPASASGGLQAFEITSDIVYCSHQNVSLTMDIYSPRSDASNRPVILYIHGGGWVFGDKTDSNIDGDIIELLNRGYVVASANYRLAPRYKFPAQIEDVKCAVCYLRTNPLKYGIDPDRIGVIGDSAGGHLASLLGLTGDGCAFSGNCQCLCQSSAVQAVVDMYGPSDLTLRFEAGNKLLMEHVFNVADPQSETIKQASPTSYVSENAPPFLIIQGENDDQVLPDQSERLYALLKANNVQVDYIPVANAGHGLAPTSSPMIPSRTDITSSIADFFDLYLK